MIYDNLSNSTEKDAEFLAAKGAKFCKGDVLDCEKLFEFCKADVVIHLAALSDVAESVKNPEETRKVNVDGTQNVLDCCVKNKVKKIIFASSAAVYGDCKNLPIREDSLMQPLSPYGQSKLDAEKIIENTCRENKISYVILRLFNIYGKGQNESYAGVITKFMQNILEEKPVVIYGDGTQTRDFVSIHDVVDAFDCAIISDKNGVYNIASGIQISINDLAQIMFEKFDNQKIIYKPKQKGDIQNSVADISLAKEKLGFVAKRKLEDEISSIYHE